MSLMGWKSPAKKRAMRLSAEHELRAQQDAYERADRIRITVLVLGVIVVWILTVGIGLAALAAGWVPIEWFWVVVNLGLAINTAVYAVSVWPKRRP